MDYLLDPEIVFLNHGSFGACPVPVFERYQELQRELADVEDKLAAARRALNAAVARFNAARESFPAVLFAGALGFREADFNTLDDSEKGVVDAVPDVRF